MLEHREGGCHCGRVRFRAQIDLDLLSQCSCTVCTKKGILHLPVAPENFELLRGKNSLTSYTFGAADFRLTHYLFSRAAATAHLGRRLVLFAGGSGGIPEVQRA